MSPTALLFGASRRARRLSLAAAVLLMIAAGPLRADWLVLSAGDQVETRGPWKVQGQLIIFTSTRGVLSSVRLSSVDVDASRAMTAEKKEAAAEEAAAPAAPAKQKPVLVLTDASLRKTAVGGTPAAAPAPEAAGEAAAAGAPIEVPAADPLETRTGRQMPGAAGARVIHWSARPTGEDQLSILGAVENTGKKVAAALTVNVKLIGFDGEDLGSQEAIVSSTALMPGGEADFEARFMGNPPFATVQFTVDLVELETQPATTEEGGEASTGEEGETAAEEGAEAGSPQAAAPAPAGAPPTGDQPHATSTTPLRSSRP